jgi:hypothetical protein
MPYSTKKWTPFQIKQKRYKVWHAYWWRNRKKLKELNRLWTQEHYSVRRAYTLKTQYGITVEFYEAECKRLDNICPICETQTKLVVDHDHKTKKFRGLLCRKCNAAIGLLADDFWKIKNAMKYLAEVRCADLAC